MKYETRERIIKVSNLANLYYLYHSIELKRRIILANNNYESCENIANFINMLGFNVSPIDFIVDEDKESNEIIDLHNNFTNYLNSCYHFLDIDTVVSFCKEVENTFHILKINMQFHYMMSSLFAYSFGIIGKSDLLYELKEVSIFTGRRADKINRRYIYRTFISVEETYNKILQKKLNRKLKQKTK